MSLALMSLLGRGWWDSVDYPTRVMDQFFATELLDNDLLPPSVYRGFLVRPRTQANINASGKSEVKNDGKELQIVLNVSQFKPEELEVKIVDNFVVVHGKHEEKSDEKGFVAREFTRKYFLPSACESDKVTSSLNADGMLTITAPKKTIEEKPKEERQITITNEKQAVENEEMSTDS